MEGCAAAGRGVGAGRWADAVSDCVARSGAGDRSHGAARRVEWPPAPDAPGPVDPRPSGDRRARGAPHAGGGPDGKEDGGPVGPCPKLRLLWTRREVPPHPVPVDNLAHALVGAALGRAVADPKVPRAALLGAVAANAPDWLEVFVGLPGDRSDYLLLHRGPTHSLAAALVETIGLTLLVGLGARWWVRRRGGVAPPPPWGWLGLCIGVTVLSHLYMDWQGSYGLRPFLPWNATWYYADWVAVVDPFFWLLPLRS